VGAAELCARATGAYATVREQFDTPIGRFEGIEEPLARIAGLTYAMNATRWLTAGRGRRGREARGALGDRQGVPHRGMRVVVNDAMDVRAGAGICRGPRNILARGYRPCRSASRSRAPTS
jgi:acyl-CoA dehydrogenase